MKFLKNALVVALLSSSQIAYSQWASTDAFLISGNIARKPNNEVVAPVSNYRKLKVKEQLSETEQVVASDAKELFENNRSLLSFMVLYKGNIIAEHYRWPSSESTAMFSWSMSKSLTGYTVGQSMCNNKIKSLDDSAQTYAQTLNGTSYGETSIKNLLTMSSGVKSPPSSSSGSVRTGQWDEAYKGFSTVDAIVKEYPGREAPQGSRFSYNNSDTFALSLVLENTGGMVTQFDNYVWKKSKPESNGYWLTDYKKVPMSAAGFSATPRDWARMALYIVDVAQGREDTKCFQDYVKDAHSTKTTSVYHGKPAYYGYQVWTHPTKSFWWAGMGGQKVGFDVDKEIVLVMFASRNDYAEDLYKKFGKWRAIL